MEEKLLPWAKQITNRHVASRLVLSLTYVHVIPFELPNQKKHEVTLPHQPSKLMLIALNHTERHILRSTEIIKSAFLEPKFVTLKTDAFLF